MKSPILICGCPGSGTSLVTKILRHAGLFTGADSGPPDARKYHESQCFKRYNERFLSETILFSHAPKSVEQFEKHNQLMVQRLESLAQLVDRDALLREYWGDSENLKAEAIWGWKDPRNSATALIWKEVFPQIRVIVICRNWKWRDLWKSSGTESGKWYRKQSTAALRDLYCDPIGLESTSVLQVEINQLTTNAEFLGRVLTWCGLSFEPASRFQEFLNQVGFER